jgi:hypothetical protein
MAPETRSGRRLAPRWRKWLLTLHIGSSVGLLGADGAVLTLDLAGAAGRDPVAVYPAAQMVATALLVPLALISLASGVALGLLTPWGLVRHWWVAIKLVLTLAGTVLALTVLTPTLAGAADAALTGEALSTGDKLEVVRNSAAASVVLLVTLVLSVHKPFGRVRRRRPRSDRAVEDDPGELQRRPGGRAAVRLGA